MQADGDSVYFAHDHLTVIEPPKRWSSLDLRELWAYRELLWVLARRDVSVRYKQTALGPAWAVLQPLLTMVVFTLVFGRLAKLPSGGVAYPVFVFAGLVPWTFFSNAVLQSASSLVGSSQLVSKVYFPRLIIPLAAVAAGVVDLMVSSLVLLALMLAYGVPWTSSLLLAPVLTLGVLLVAAGVGTLFAALTVAYRDFRYVVPFALQLWLFVTPVVYSSDLVPARWRFLLALNPMTGFIEALHAVVVGRPPDWAGVLMASFTGALTLVLGVAYFEHVERRFADII